MSNCCLLPFLFDSVVKEIATQQFFPIHFDGIFSGMSRSIENILRNFLLGMRVDQLHCNVN
jgi:hypothetical protein